MKLRSLFKLDARWYVVMAIMIMAFLTLSREGNIVLRHTILICLISCTADFIIFFLLNRRRIFPLSALVSGLIISSVMAPTKLFYIAPLAAILSKHIIKYSGRHIFNPAGFGLLLANALWNIPLSWWLTTNVTIIIFFGIFLAYKMKKVSLVVSVIGTTFILSMIYSLMKHQAAVANSGLVNLFFAFFMVPEPKTSPVSLKPKALYGMLVASLGMMSFVVLPQYDFLMVSLILGNILGVFLRKVR